MGIDFGKLGSGKSVDTLIKPREIFDVLPKRTHKKYPYLRDVQTEVIEQWFAQRDKKDVVIKMNTGSGKTVVGLLLLKSCINENKGPAVYVASDKYLVEQVQKEAYALGMDVVEDPCSPGFLKGKNILVINIHKLINGKSVFGIGEAGAKIPIGSILIDDAHACLSSAESQFTLRIQATNSVYNELFELFENDLRQQSETRVLDIKSQDPSINMLVPFWSWINRHKDVAKALFKVKDDENVKFIWPLIKDYLKLCRCVIGGGEIEISPRCLPIEVIPSFVNAKRKIFMSANLVDDSILVSDFNANPLYISEHITPKNASDIGDRMILSPQELNTDLEDEELKDFIFKLSKDHNVVVIVPSNSRSEFWCDVATHILTAANLYEGINDLKKKHVGLVVLVNKYDGIDLPDDACRILVIDGLPTARRKIDEIEQAVLSESDEFLRRQIQRIEQGMGRGVRSNDDFCVVLLMGASLMSQLYSAEAISKFSPAVQAQIKLSNKLSDQIRGEDLAEIKKIIEYCLERNPEWIKVSKGALVGIEYPTKGLINPTIALQREAFDAAVIEDYPRAFDKMQEAVNLHVDSRVKGWLKQQLSEFKHFTDPVESQKILKSALSENRRILRPIAGISYERLNTAQLNQAKNAIGHFERFESKRNDMIMEINGNLDDLSFIPETANKFEEALRALSLCLGFVGQRPESEFGKGPDVLWGVGNSEYFVIECKNCATSKTISKDYCNQLNGSMAWFAEKYDTSCKATPILIHPVNFFEFAASPHKDTRIMTRDILSEFKRSIRDFIKAISSLPKLNDIKKINDLLEHHSLTGKKIVSRFTTKYTTQSK